MTTLAAQVMAQKPDISIIVPAHAPTSVYGACLAALRNMVDADVEVIIVNAGLDPQTGDMAIAHGFTCVTTDGPRGPAAARNLGARQATGEILWFLDSDVVATRVGLEHMRRRFADEKISALIGSYDDAPSETGCCSQFRNLLHHYVHQQQGRTTGQTDTFWGACGAIRRCVFFQTGGFDEQYTQPSVEDIEFGYRLSDIHCTIWLDPDLQVKHLKRWTLYSMIKTDLLCRAIPWTELLVSRRCDATALNLNWHHRLNLLLTLGVDLSLVSACFYPAGFGLAALFLLIFTASNRGFLTLLLRQRGFPLAALGPFLLLVHYQTAGLGYVIGLLKHHCAPRKPLKMVIRQAT